MNRRSFFRFVAGALAWAQTKHLAWACPERTHLWAQFAKGTDGQFLKLGATHLYWEDSGVSEKFRLFAPHEPNPDDAYDITYHLGGRL